MSPDTKKKRTISLKVPHIRITKKNLSEGTGNETKQNEPGIRKIKIDKTGNIAIPRVPIAKTHHVLEKSERSDYRSPRMVQADEPEVSGITEDELQMRFGSDKESSDKKFSQKLFKSLTQGGKKEIEQYSFRKHGSLVEVKLPSYYEILREYWVEPGRAKVFITLNRKSRLKEYLLFEPALSTFEYEILERLHEDLRDVLILVDEELGEDRRVILITKVAELMKYYGIHLEAKSLYKIQYYIDRNYLGWGRINALMLDPNIEDISCDGNKIPIFLFHRTEQNIKTNIVFDEDSLRAIGITLAQRSGKHVSAANPIVDATLPDGSRLQLTFGEEVTTRGTSFTVRKFREEPFTPIDLISLKTFNAEMLVYFWLAIENNKSIVFIGGTASGKTTSLNAVSFFIPPLSKVISIEDTREVTMFHENWIASVTREAMAETGSVIDMFTLLKAAMRQRPEYILVGEVRGSEAQTLFQAMNTGHTTFSTMHAGSVDAAIHRLENEPLNVPRNMLQALNIISIQKQIQMGPDRARRCEEIVEIAGIDPTTGNIMVNTVFEYDPIGDSFAYTGRSQVLGEISSTLGWSREELLEEMERRKSVILAMQDQEIRDYIRFTKVIQAYFIDKHHVIDSLKNLTEIAT